jgi:hypothetical protein
MTIRGLGVAGALLALGLTGGAARADLLSRELPVETGKIVDLREANADGLRLDALQVELPRPDLPGGGVRLQVALTNTGEVPRRAGVAVALFDDQGRLVGVASGGSRMVALRPGQTKFYTLDVDHVVAEAARATKLRVSMESR